MQEPLRIAGQERNCLTLLTGGNSFRVNEEFFIRQWGGEVGGRDEQSTCGHFKSQCVFGARVRKLPQTRCGDISVAAA